MSAPQREFGFRGAAPRWWVVLSVLLGLSVYAYTRADEQRGGADTAAELTGSTMGTSYRVILARSLARAEHAALTHELSSLLTQINQQMSTYEPASELSRFNRHASTEPFRVSPSVAEVVRAAISVSHASGGAFDVTVSPLVDAWGFGPQGRPERAPSEDELSALRQRVGYTKLELQGDHLRKTHPLLEVDLSAIAKGHAVDRVASLLERRGHTSYLVEIGGELRGRGRRADGRPFRVGIESPTDGRRHVQTVVALEDGALATSGNYRNHHELEGELAVHTLDPRSGRPAQHGLLSASVLHESCALADAWATALMALGPERAMETAEAEGLDVLLLVAEHDGQLRERETAGFRARRLLRAP